MMMLVITTIIIIDYTKQVMNSTVSHHLKSMLSKIPTCPVSWQAPSSIWSMMS